MSKLAFGYPIDPGGGLDGDLANANPTLSTGTPVSGYPVTNIHNGNPALPLKLTGKEILLYWDFAGARSISRVALINHNLDAGLNISVQAGTSPSLASFSRQITIPAVDHAGYTVSPFLDVSDAGAFRYWGINNVGNANTSNIIIGEICIQADNRSLTRNIGFESSLVETYHTVRHRTGGGADLVYQQGGRIKAIRNAPLRTDDSATVQQWYRVCRGNSKPHLVIPDPAVNEAWYGRFDMEALSMTLSIGGSAARAMTLNWTEVSRGLPWAEL